MIRITRLDGSELTINSDLLEAIEQTPDTVVTLLNGRKLMVRETVDEVVARVIDYRRKSGVCALLQDHLRAAASATHVAAGTGRQD